MLIMAEVSSEMGIELRSAALAEGRSVAAEVGIRLERLAELEARLALGSRAVVSGDDDKLLLRTSSTFWSTS